MFERAVGLLPEQGGSQDIVTTMKLFNDKGDLLYKGLEDYSMKEHIAQDIEKIDANNLVRLIELYKNDTMFRKFLTNSLLEKIYDGAIIGAE